MKTRLLNLAQHPNVQAVKGYYERLSSRDQSLLCALGLFLTVVLFYALVWRPLDVWSDQQMSDYRKQVETMAWLHQNVSKVQALEQKAASSGNLDMPTVVTNVAKQTGVTIYRIQPDKKGVGVWLEDAAYQKVLEWIMTLENKYEIIVQQIKIDRLKDEGRVKGYLHFKR